MKMKKKLKYSLRAAAALLAVLCLIAAAALPALADLEDTVSEFPFAAAYNEDSDLYNLTAAVVLEYDDEDLLVYTSSDILDDDASYYAVFTSYSDDCYNGWVLTYSGYSEELDLLEWVAEDAAGDEAAIGVSSGYKGMEVTAYYYDSSMNLKSATVKIKGYSTDSYGNYMLKVDKLPDTDVYPILLADSNGNCVGIASSDDTKAVYAPSLNENLFYSVNSGLSGAATAGIVIAVVVVIIIIVVVIIVLKKKKGGGKPDKGNGVSAGGGYAGESGQSGGTGYSGSGYSGAGGGIYGEYNGVSGSSYTGDSGQAGGTGYSGSGYSAPGGGSYGEYNGASGGSYAGESGQAGGMGYAGPGGSYSGYSDVSGTGYAGGTGYSAFGNGGYGGYNDASAKGYAGGSDPAGSSGYSGSGYSASGGGSYGEYNGASAGGYAGTGSQAGSGQHINNDSGLRIQSESGTFAGRRFAIAPSLRIGRDPSRNDLVYPEHTQGISAVHCRLVYQGGRLFLIDLGSTYGTFLNNGQRLPANQAVAVNPGDRFYLADRHEQFVIVISGE